MIPKVTDVESTGDAVKVASGAQNVSREDAHQPDYSADTSATDRKFQEMQRKTAKQLDYMPVVYLTAALAVVGIVSTMVNPMVFGDQVSDSFDLTALGEIALPSGAGAATFAAIGLVEGHGVFPGLMGSNIKAAEAEDLSARAGDGTGVPLVGQVNWDELRQKQTRPDLANTAYSTGYMIAAGTAFFIALNLVDVIIEMLAELIADETASKGVAYGLTMTVNPLLGLSFPETIKFFDRQLRACMLNAGLNALQLPENLGLVNGAAFLSVGVLKVLANELNYGFADPVVNSVFDAGVAGGVTVAASIVIDNSLDNILSKGVNKAVQSVGSVISLLTTCDSKSLCLSNGHVRLPSNDSH